MHMFYFIDFRESKGHGSKRSSTGAQHHSKKDKKKHKHKHKSKHGVDEEKKKNKHSGSNDDRHRHKHKKRKRAESRSTMSVVLPPTPLETAIYIDDAPTAKQVMLLDENSLQVLLLLQLFISFTLSLFNP